MKKGKHYRNKESKKKRKNRVERGNGKKDIIREGKGEGRRERERKREEVYW